ncbi:MT-A70 family methyltransferase [Limimaricola hongkongensis]|uniref:Adenine-specific DNA methyltransferase n=1 Tax=Limimaricola hongkongensis DSM 17492 TaxID=1122180 RepID=A0A017HB95_9RHOB|nr:MT-A70 family methyltransferase [Limimaricola hongkongensis]EYD71787.1 Adenine-specific DNA methyltransferase [Limimaricola hongkongensis DSM 17492]
MGPFDIILADPPWRFASNSEAKPGRNPRRHYPCMRDEEICALPVARWAAPAALLLMWTTSPMLDRSMAIPRAWGFRYVSSLVWTKDRIGTGYWARNRHELVLICKRGRFDCPRPAPFADSVISGQQREHSRKPDALHAQIDAAWPEARKLELFARQERPGWTAWGNDTARFAA